MRIGNVILGVNSVTISYLSHYDTSLQNAANIMTKCDSYFIVNSDRSLLQNASYFLLQNATVISKCDVYYKLRQHNNKIIANSF